MITPPKEFLHNFSPGLLASSFTHLHTVHHPISKVDFKNPNLMLQDVAKAVNMSNSRFSTVFSQQSGQTFTEYLMYTLVKVKSLSRVRLFVTP